MTSSPPSIQDLSWQSRFVERFPGDPEKRNFTRAVRHVLYSEVSPTAVMAPRLLGWSAPLAVEIGVRRPDPEDREAIEVLSGSRVLPRMRPYAARYGGHQFGHWAGQLGDGRAITLGEVAAPDGHLMEFQLKGAGPTPYSRRADGRAVLRSSVREFLCSEAMHFLGVPTTRALSLVTTGEPVVRDMFYDGNPRPEPGAVVCRVSPTFLRFGNFEILAATEEIDLLKDLTNQVIQDHYPELDPGDPDVHGKFLDEVARRTAQMVVHWMRVGFVHGVMNTDNMSILGLTIDYGPYGWLEPYDPDWTPNTTDAEGRRYRFEAQPAIAGWNLARLCEALHPLIRNEERLLQTLEIYRSTLGDAYARMMASKLGLPIHPGESLTSLLDGLFLLLRQTETDYTIFFRKLADWKIQAETSTDFIETILPSFYRVEELSSELRERWLDWAVRYKDQVRQTGIPDRERAAAMNRVNPKYVLRNYLSQNAITAAEQGDPSVLERLFRVLQRPYDEQPGEDDLAARRPEWARSAPGCSALSCSS